MIVHFVEGALFQVFCVVLDNMAVDIQVPAPAFSLWRPPDCLKLSIIASATVHVIAHGGMSYAMMFASTPHRDRCHRQTMCIGMLCAVLLTIHSVRDDAHARHVTRHRRRHSRRCPSRARRAEGQGASSHRAVFVAAHVSQTVAMHRSRVQSSVTEFVVPANA